MTTTLEAAMARRRTRRWSLANVAVPLIMFSGTALLPYPSAATWITDIAHASDVSAYVAEVTGAGNEELAARLTAARTYNAHLPAGPLRDPYLLNDAGDIEDSRDDWKAYAQLLSPSPSAPMGRIRIPRIDVDLAIFHGTPEDTLARGIGHGTRR